MLPVVVYPGWKDVPYVRCLYNNKEVEYAAYHGAWYPLSKNISSHTQILHLHWTADLFAVTQKNTLHFLVRYLISVIDLLWVVYVRRVKIVWTVHNLYAHGCIHKQADKMARKLLGKVAAKVIVHSPTAGKLVTEEFSVSEKKIEVVYHGHFIAEYPNETTQEQARKKLNIDSGKKVYLFFGSVIDYKGCKNLVAAFNEWKPEDAVLIIAGKNAATLLNSNNNIRVYDGYIADNDMQLYLNATDWVVLPYKEILTSATLITAMGFRKAVIIPNIGTLPDYIHENGGIIYNSKEKDSLLSALQKSRSVNAEAAGNHNYNKALSFDWKQIQLQTQKIYQSI